MTQDESAPTSRTNHRLMVLGIDLVGGNRSVTMQPGLNFVHGTITTGKTTFVRLLRALLGTVPDDLPAETGIVSSLKAVIKTGEKVWIVNRPLVTTRTAPVDVVESDPPADEEGIAIRLPASGANTSFGRFIQDQTSIPAVSVPQAKSKPAGNLTSVTMTDWLGYCIVTGDEIDSQVFGHLHPFRNQKRKWIFELAYGLYDSILAKLAADLNLINSQIAALEHEEEFQHKFLSGTPFANQDALEARVSEIDRDLSAVDLGGREKAEEVILLHDVERLRRKLLTVRTELAILADEFRRNQGQLQDLEDLLGQLKSQFARLTRAVVSDEWLVDFDFVVCPRCGSDVSPVRSDSEHCYLCLQPPQPTASRDAFMTEQDRIVGQIQETEAIIASRKKALEEIAEGLTEKRHAETFLAEQLNATTNSFVSDSASELQELAARKSYLLAEKSKMEDYRSVLDRFHETGKSRQELEEKREEIEEAIERRDFSTSVAEGNIVALEVRIKEYLERLNIPLFGDSLSVKINRETYLPEISGRTFNELSSQGLKTLVNVAHSLAHHTVSIDRGIPLPGLLVLDGLSANAGRKGFDAERIQDMYRLLLNVAEEYADDLQIIAVDNDAPAVFDEALSDKVVLHLTPQDKLIRDPSGNSFSISV
ncbi:hypothetical protein [Streptomyces sp. NBC_00620]|uniref:hypothetical protein n=1 Tax=Streptomyces sp. NBC_00620 TaxID=2903666 RepID=UPI00225241F5|nr:hypothetical protein [Streptomyces sp. NBC_00620]MCX4974513.1 hypothetical protein [Streptomyces sp. NBC_00620]